MKNPQCTAHARTTGEQCRNPAMNGATVCRMHGGAAPQVRARAQRRQQDALAALILARGVRRGEIDLDPQTGRYAWLR